MLGFTLWIEKQKSHKNISRKHMHDATMIACCTKNSRQNRPHQTAGSAPMPLPSKNVQPQAFRRISRVSSYPARGKRGRANCRAAGSTNRMFPNGRPRPPPRPVPRPPAPTLRPSPSLFDDTGSSRAGSSKTHRCSPTTPASALRSLTASSAPGNSRRLQVST